MLSLKEGVLKMVSSINDESLLELVKADIEHFADHKTDIIDELTFSHREELINLAEEPGNKNILTEAEYKESTRKWRMK